MVALSRFAAGIAVFLPLGAFPLSLTVDKMSNFYQPYVHPNLRLTISLRGK